MSQGLGNKHLFGVCSVRVAVAVTVCGVSGSVRSLKATSEGGVGPRAGRQ